MDDLLATKLRVPPLPGSVIHRDRLVEALEREIPAYKITLVAAPAGYGKTTLLAQWVHASRLRSAWLTFEEEDNDLERFFRYLVAAWEQIQPGIRDSPVGLLLDDPSPDSKAVLSAFLNTADEAPGPLVFVLDDYHLITEPAIHQTLAYLIDHLPPALHFVLVGRGEPPLPLARYRARHTLLELRAEELAFLPQETENFFVQTMQLALNSDGIQRLHGLLEGWVAGLQLAALALRRRPIGSAEPLMNEPPVSGRTRFIADYLSEDVLARVPEDMRHFLLRTSILEQLCGPLCDAVTGQGGGQAMLETLERENLFLVPLDDQREWFRYHRLFADFLRAELDRSDPGEIAELHRRAAAWNFQQNQPEPAFRHAAAAQDARLVIEIGERFFIPKLLGGEIVTARRWLESLPGEWIETYPELGHFQAALLLFTGQLEACMRKLDELEQQALANGAPVILARVNAVRCFIACYQRDLEPAEALASRALRDLPEEDLYLRRGLYGSLGDTYRAMGRWREARDYYRKLLDLPVSPDARFYLVHVYGALADLDLTQGHLRDAAANWERALAIIRQPEMRGKIPLPLTGWVYIRMGEFLYEWNQLQAAWEHLSQGLERAELGGDVRALIAGYLIACRLKLSEGDDAEASAFLERARPLLEQAPLAEWISRFERLQLEFWLAQDRLRPALDWARQKLQDSAAAGGLEHEAASLAAARVLVAKGDPQSLEQALRLLARLLGAVEGEGRQLLFIEALALQALAEWNRGDRPRALTALEHCLRLAQPEGCVRLFADLGVPMARLLQEARSRSVMPEYIDTLLAAFHEPTARQPESTLPEPLTGREQEILERIAAGLSNREIAAEFVISPETVKKHLGSIYGKLGVGSRTQAVSRARELHLFN